MNFSKIVCSFVFILPFCIRYCNAQRISKSELNDSIQNFSYFTIHKDNYFITGVPLTNDINSNTADAKYQISFKQMITRDKLPWDTYLFITYTQKAFWNIYKDSYPFRDINFNPSLVLGKTIFNKSQKLEGIATIAFEHESNGRDSIYSRSWNRISGSFITSLTKRTVAEFKAWIPFGYKSGNPELLEYAGLGEINLEHELKKNRIYLNVMFRKGLNFKAKGVFRPRLYFAPFGKNISNQYIMVEWYWGQGESLLEYEESRSMIRVGYVIKSNEFNFFRMKN
ncbi:phospholipase A [Muricauda sp. 334s03]|uniref:Phosphatidylcholine 1-acylhydrolase n=1 Tax=Flagellimonas yonaguniensis TaxID=3031325 RepID=A0ABT5Y352_9FLAO|nr:phospholipase A [[Muricauda] yonaguniensis]MDF0717741.1 phospholipase A [[Muricauda] yonaguniensis]